MRKSIIAGVGVVLLVMAAVITWLTLSSSTSDSPPPEEPEEVDLASLYEPGAPVPPEATEIAQDLVADEEQTQRAALTPELDEFLPEGRLFPEGATLHLEDGTWHEEHGYANALAELEVPGEPTQRVFLGFAPREDGWRISLAEVYQ